MFSHRHGEALEHCHGLTDAHIDGSGFPVPVPVPLYVPLTPTDYQAEGDYYLGKIVFDHGDGTFDIMYEDGDQEQRVPLTRIRKVKDPESIRKVNQSKEDAEP